MKGSYLAGVLDMRPATEIDERTTPEESNGVASDLPQKMALKRVRRKELVRKCAINYETLKGRVIRCELPRNDHQIMEIMCGDTTSFRARKMAFVEESAGRNRRPIAEVEFGSEFFLQRGT